MASNQVISVVGHVNPDTDSICSAISYSYLKHAVTGDNYQPGRAGVINPETRFVLDRFQVKDPVYLDDVRQRVR
ncbi:MAG: DHH family phosphoesterase, partial [Lachnospiraceae bacterium]